MILLFSDSAALRKIAKKYDKVAGGSQQNPRLETFDTLLKDPLDTLEFLDYLGHGIGDSKTLKMLGGAGFLTRGHRGARDPGPSAVHAVIV